MMTFTAKNLEYLRSHVTSGLPSNEVFILKARAIAGSRLINVTEAWLQDSINLMSRGHSNCATSLLLIGQVCHQPCPKMFLSGQGVKRASETPVSPGGSLGQHSCVQSSGTLSPEPRSFIPLRAETAHWQWGTKLGNQGKNKAWPGGKGLAALAYQTRGWLSHSSWRRCSENIVLRRVLETFPKKNTDGEQKSQARVSS